MWYHLPAMSFRDHFSVRAEDYARYRPKYPKEMYACLAGVAPGRRLALDCATGSGQAASGLAAHFERVIATDASPEQLARAVAHERVDYAVAYAEAAPVLEHSVDLVVAAAAAHWFDLDRFYDDVRRILRPRGVIAVWSYYMFEAEAGVTEVMTRYADEILRDYWPERMHLNQAHYDGLPFPFQRIDAPRLLMEADWTLEQMLGFATTWSASQRYERKHGTHPLELVIADLERAWGDPTRRLRLRWPLHMRVGTTAQI